MISGQICSVRRRGGEVAQADGAGGANAVLGPGAPAVAQLRFGDRDVLDVGGEAGQAHPVGVSVAELGTGAQEVPALARNADPLRRRRPGGRTRR